MEIKHICVIGAGISGLVTAKTFIEEGIDWMKTQYNSVVARATCISSFSLRYTDQLMEDMGANNQLGVWKGISQIMMPVDLSLYNKLRQELKSQRLRNINNSPNQLTESL